MDLTLLYIFLVIIVAIGIVVGYKAVKKTIKRKAIEKVGKVLISNLPPGEQLIVYTKANTAGASDGINFLAGALGRALISSSGLELYIGLTKFNLYLLQAINEENIGQIQSISLNEIIEMEFSGGAYDNSTVKVKTQKGEFLLYVSQIWADNAAVMAHYFNTTLRSAIATQIPGEIPYPKVFLEQPPPLQSETKKI